MDYQILKVLMYSVMILGVLVYILKTAFKCHLRCAKNKSGKRETKFNVSLRGDETPSTTSSETASPPHDTDVPSPPQVIVDVDEESPLLTSV